MIAYDIDGVFVDFTRDCFIPAGEILLDRALPQLREDTYDLREQLEISDAEHRRIWASPELRRMLLAAPPIDRSSGFLLDAEPHCFITSRGTSALERDVAQLIRVITRRWVRATLRDYAEIHFVPATRKANLAMDLRVRRMWEDHPHTAVALAEAGIEVRMPSYGYNRAVQHPRITRVEGWREPSLFDLQASDGPQLAVGVRTTSRTTLRGGGSDGR